MRTIVLAALMSAMLLAFTNSVDACPITIFDDVVGPCGGWGEDVVVGGGENKDLVRTLGKSFEALASADYESGSASNWSGGSFVALGGFTGFGVAPSFHWGSGLSGWTRGRGDRFNGATLSEDESDSSSPEQPGLSKSDSFPSSAAAAKPGEHAANNGVDTHGRGHTNRPTGSQAGTVPPQKPVVPVPEPSSSMLFALGLALVFYRRSLA